MPAKEGAVSYSHSDTEALQQSSTTLLLTQKDACASASSKAAVQRSCKVLLSIAAIV